MPCGTCMCQPFLLKLFSIIPISFAPIFLHISPDLRFGFFLERCDLIMIDNHYDCYESGAPDVVFRRAGTALGNAKMIAQVVMQT